MPLLGNTLPILRPPDRSTPAIQTGWNEDLIRNMHDVLGRLSQQLTAQTFGGLPTGSSRPASVKANVFWLDNTTAAAPIVKLYDGTDDITVMTFAYSGNTVTWNGLLNIVNDTSPQLGGNLDLNSKVITGLEIGTDVQALDAILTSLAAGDLIAASFIVKTADETVNNSTTFQNDNHLAFAMAANITYLVDTILLISAANNLPNFKFKWVIPASCTIFWGNIHSLSWIGASLFLTESDNVITDSLVGVSGMAIRAVVRNGANAGNLQLQWAQNSAHASDSKVLKHSHMSIRKLGAT